MKEQRKNRVRIFERNEHGIAGTVDIESPEPSLWSNYWESTLNQQGRESLLSVPNDGSNATPTFHILLPKGHSTPVETLLKLEYAILNHGPHAPPGTIQYLQKKPGFLFVFEDGTVMPPEILVEAAHCNVAEVPRFPTPDSSVSFWEFGSVCTTKRKGAYGKLLGSMPLRCRRTRAIAWPFTWDGVFREPKTDHDFELLQAAEDERLAALKDNTAWDEWNRRNRPNQ